MSLLKKFFILLLEKKIKKNEKEFPFNDINSILIRPIGEAIGDAVIHTAHISQLKQIFPNAKIGVITKKSNEIIFKNSKLVDIIINRKLINYFLQFKKWDLLLDFENNFNSSSLLMDRIIMPKYNVIFMKRYKKHYNTDSIDSYNFHFKQKETEKLGNYLKNSVFNQKYNLQEPHSILHTNKILDFYYDKYYWTDNKVRVLLCPQGSKRQIPEIELANLLNSSTIHSISNKIEYVLSYTITSKSYYHNLIKLCPNLNIKYSKETTLVEFFSLTKSSNLVIAVDGGALHIACAFNKPLLSFFADARPNLDIWEPLLPKDIPHHRILTPKTHNPNLTEHFIISDGIKWLLYYLQLYSTKLDKELI
ncbi:lipopolysaccharide heptosyltransferase family protein [Muribacter muris]|uniref:Lipopolysaccharide heptosyltransferase family protein n=1 Tax=Muribacter muris TaxID=67855 RepID=A0A4Y9K5S1_9PAST|nr:glycosyltransferase family 9 protein [Muribacter muris]MBF0784502.1 glycosyltransferase family 9 protein [Muribacter muris]MBF0826202.1 glycosyltransferase family 9 protein [Muribacter muris]TFV12016.1 lipopolysaccharide heptosyltransferase family protein [Muribacter muris]